MNEPKESIIKASLRKLCTSFFSVLGFFLAIFAALLLFSVFGTGAKGELEQKYKPEVVPGPNRQRESLSKDTSLILKVNIEGVIGLTDLTSAKVERLLIESREGSLKDNRVKALLLSINSPGGSVIDSDGIYRLIKAYKERYKVPVFAYVNGLSASGGFYIMAAADKVYASPVSLIGSVGVFIPTFFNVHTLLKDFKIETETVSAGKGKDAMNPFRAWKKEDSANFQNIVDTYYSQFVHIVTENRNRVDKEQLITVYGAEVFPAETSKAIGYIDEVADSIDTPLADLIQTLELKEEDVQVIEMNDKSWVSELFSNKEELLSQSIIHLLTGHVEDHPKLNGQFLYLFRPQ